MYYNKNTQSQPTGQDLYMTVSAYNGITTNEQSNYQYQVTYKKCSSNMHTLLLRKLNILHANWNLSFTVYLNQPLYSYERFIHRAI